MTMTETDRCACARCRCHDANRQGPFPHREFLELFDIVEPAPPSYEVSQELLEAGAEVDRALAVYDQAKEVWIEAVGEQRELDRRRVGQVERDEAGGVVQLARGALDREGERLQAARVTYNRIAKAEEHARNAAEYQATVEAQEMAKADRIATQDEELTRRLTRRWKRSKS